MKEMTREQLPKKLILEKGQTIVDEERTAVVLATVNNYKTILGEEIVTRYNSYNFRNDNWLENYFEIVSFITAQLIQNPDGDTMIKWQQERQGTGGLYTMAQTWADEFEQEFRNKDWDDGSYYETIEEWLDKKNAAPPAE